MTASTAAEPGSTRVLVGGFGVLGHGDLDLGRHAIERLATEDLGRGVVVADLYEADVAEQLRRLRPASLVLVGAVTRGRPAGTVTRRRAEPGGPTTKEARQAGSEAATGSVGVDMLLEGLDVLPARTVCVEVEPAQTGPGDGLSPQALAGLEPALELVRAEVRRSSLLELAEELRARLELGHLEWSPARDTMQALLAELVILDREGRWGRTFSERDRLRLQIAMGQHGEGLEGLDWSLWWTLIEELDRLQPLEARAGLP